MSWLQRAQRSCSLPLNRDLVLCRLVRFDCHLSRQSTQVPQITGFLVEAPCGVSRLLHTAATQAAHLAAGERVSSIANVVLRGRIFHFRRRVPNDLRSRLSCDEPLRCLPPASQGRDPPVPVAAMVARQLDEVGREPRLVVPTARHLAARVERCGPSARAGATPGGGERPPHRLDAEPATRGAHQVPAAASQGMSLASVSSATAKRRLASPCAAAGSPSQAPSVASPGPTSSRRSPDAGDRHVTSVTLIARMASATLRPCDTSPSTGRSLATISFRLVLLPRHPIRPCSPQSHASGQTTSKGEDQSGVRSQRYRKFHPRSVITTHACFQPRRDR